MQFAETAPSPHALIPQQGISACHDLTFCIDLPAMINSWQNHGQVSARNQ
jgi:hypothetical protein